MRSTEFFSVRAIVVVLFLAAGVGVSAQINNNRSTISGFVFNEQRRPVPEINVELQNEVNSTLARARTDNSGRFYFGGLSQGRFTIKVLPYGTNYQEQSSDVEIAGYGATGRQLAENVQRDIYLKLRKGADSVPFVNAVLFAQDIPKEAKKAYEAASDDLDNKRKEEGIAGLKRSIELFPDYFMALQKLGIMYISQQKYDDAKKMFKRAVDVNKDSFDCLYGLAYSEYALGNFDSSITSAERSIAIKPDSMEVNLLLGVAYRQAKDYKKSESAFLKAEKIADGTSPDVHYQLALLYAYNLKQYGDAAKQLELFLKEAPDAKDKEAIKKLIKEYKDKDKNKS